jgi:mycothiol system anti-sigma-R factor
MTSGSGHDERGARLDCDDAVHVLYEYLDGELTEERRILIQAHLESCPPCFEGYEFEYELRQVIARKCRDEVPADLRARIAAAIEQGQGQGNTPGR